MEGEEQIETTGQSMMSSWGWVVKPAVFLILGLLVLFFAVRPLVARLTTPPSLPVQLPQDGLPVRVADYEAEIVESPEDLTVKQAVKMASQNPSTAASVIRTWIKEEQQAERMEKV